MKKSVIKIGIIAAALCLAIFASAVYAVGAEEPEYYVCFSTENYAVRNANRMIKTEEGYILEDVSISSATGFYVTDNAGTRYTAADNDDLHTSEVGTYSYDILFAPDGVIPDGWEETGCRVSYRFHVPASYEVTVGGEAMPLEYNPYFTDYDLYYISCTYIEGGSAVTYEEETHDISASGYYRILFTPGALRQSDTYMFNDKGEYGSGDGYNYRLYIDDAPRYYVAIAGGAEGESEVRINGEPSYLLTRDESATATIRYKSKPLFVGERDSLVKYRIYEETPSGYRMIDDDNDSETEISDMIVGDVGWYTVSFTDGGSVFAVGTEYDERDFGGYYAAGEFDNYCYTEDGGLDLDGKYLFTEVEFGDDDYTEDYRQYILYIDVTKEEADGGAELYITDGERKYKDGVSYIRLNAAGRYKFLFSDEHDYGRGRNYRFTLEDGSKTETEVVISTAEEYNAFAAECNRSADYSADKTVYIKNDIDFAGKTVTAISSFGGKIEGGYHTLKNITLSSDTDRAGLIELLTKNGSIKRLNVEITISAKDAQYVGTVCENYGLIDEVTVGGSVTGGRYVGGIVGYNGYAQAGSGDVVSDSDNAYVIGKIRDSVNNAVVRGKVYAGGIVGYNGGEVEGATNNGRINSSAFSSSDVILGVGGICGFSYGKVTSSLNLASVGGDFGQGIGGICGISTGEVYFSTNSAAVEGYRYVGGIVGFYGNDSSGNGSGDTGIFGDASGGTTAEPMGRNRILLYNINLGAVTSESYVGGIIGYAQTADLTVRACASEGDVSATAGSYAGGVCGYAASIIESCLGLGRVSAEGLNGGLYVGGVCGYGENIRYCMSSAAVEGSDVVGGICGDHAGTLVGSYSNALLTVSEEAEHIGGICGRSSAYDHASDSFTAVSYNYFIGEDIGGIDGVTYGGGYDDAARRITAEELSSVGALSPSLGAGFDAEYWLGGIIEPSYPVSRAFEEAVDGEVFGDSARYDALFAEYAERLSAIAEGGARVSCIVVFKEWNPDNGDLYDPDIQYDNFETVSAVRCFGGDATDPPAFVYAKEEEGRWITHGDKADYFASYSVGEVTGNTVIYAEYDEVHTTLSAGDALIEGRFGSNAKAELITVGKYYAVNITGEEVGEVTLKFRVGKNADKYKLFVVTDGAEKEVSATVVGDCLSFKYTPGALFRTEQIVGGLPAWAIGLIFGLVGAAVVGMAWLIVFLCKRAKKRSKSK